PLTPQPKPKGLRRMRGQTRPGRADKNATAPAEEMIGMRVANAAQLRLSLVVQNVDWRWRKSHQNKNRTAPRLRTRETCGSESVPTGGEPPLAHASGYKRAVGACTCQAANSPRIASAVLRDSGLRCYSSWVAAQSLFAPNSDRRPRAATPTILECRRSPYFSAVVASASLIV